MTRLTWRFAAGLCLCAGLFAGSRLVAPAKADDFRKVLGGNLLRVMEQTEKVSTELQAQ